MPVNRDIRAYLKSLPRPARRALGAEAICSTIGPFSVIFCWGIATVVAMAVASPGYPSLGIAAKGWAWLVFGLGVGLAFGLACLRLISSLALRRFLTQVSPDGHLPDCPACGRDLRESLSSNCPKCGCPVVIPPCA